jgi:5-methylthioribose kinase
MRAQIRLDEANLADYLGKQGFIPRGEAVVVEPVGDGNINWVRRVRGDFGSRVVKQARPALERFPEYRAPTHRIVIEARFYEAAAPFDRDAVCPKVLGFDPEQRVLVLEDLGDALRLDAAPASRVPETGRRLAGFLGRLHAGTRDADLAERFRNDDMRRLHGDHIYRLPYRPNDFPLSDRVAERARALRADAPLLARIDAAHARYLEPRGSLVHGDVQASNVLLTTAGPKLLDAEIAHVGDPAFDLGQLLAHLLLPAAARGEPETAADTLQTVWQAYRDEAGSAPSLLAHAALHAGIELLRRTIGAARVPAVQRDDAALAVLDEGVRLVHEARLPDPGR